MIKKYIRKIILEVLTEQTGYSLPENQFKNLYRDQSDLRDQISALCKHLGVWMSMGGKYEVKNLKLLTPVMDDSVTIIK